MNKVKHFVKLHGTGNDFIIVEPSFFGLNNQKPKINTFSQQQKLIIVPQVIQLCRTKFSVGGDGVLLVSKNQGENVYKMSLFTADGSMAPNCGNGLRCVALYLHKRKGFGLGQNFAINTDSGDKLTEITLTENKQYYVKINLKSPSAITELFTHRNNPKIQNYMSKAVVYSCSIGNHHLIIFLQKESFELVEKDNVFALIAFELIGKQLVNVNFCCVQSSKNLKIVTCQFGAGVTMACGTGSSLSAYVGFATGRLQSQVNVQTRGGVLKISCVKKQEGDYDVFMNGPAKWVYSGQIQQENQ